MREKLKLKTIGVFTEIANPAIPGLSIRKKKFQYKCSYCNELKADHPARLYNHIFMETGNFSCLQLDRETRVALARKLPKVELAKYAPPFAPYASDAMEFDDGHRINVTSHVHDELGSSPSVASASVDSIPAETGGQSWTESSAAPPAKKRRSDVVSNVHDDVLLLAAEREHFRRSMCRLVVETNIPLTWVEHKYVKTFFSEFLDVKYRQAVPSANELRSTVVQHVFQSAIEDMRSSVNNATHVTIVTDAWSSYRKQRACNYVALTPRPVFFRVVHHSAAVPVGNQLADQLRSFPHPNKLAGVVCDHVSVMEKSFDLLKTEFPHVVFAGCHCHGINLFFKDVFGKKLACVKPRTSGSSCADAVVGESVLAAPSSIDDDDEDLPCVEESADPLRDEDPEAYVKCKEIVAGQYTLPQLAVIATNITSFFCKHQYARRRLEEMLEQSKKCMLAMPGKTQWDSYIRCINCVQGAEREIKDLLNHDEQIRDTAKDTTMYHLVTTDSALFDFFRMVVTAFNPLAKLATVLKSGQANLSFAFHQMANFEDFLKSSDLGHRYPAIPTFFQKRREVLYSPAALAGYLLDPRYNGARLTADQKLQATIWLSQMLDAQAYDEWLSYRAIDDRQLRSSIDKYIASDQPSFKIWQFMEEDGLFPNLAKVASRLLAVACNSVAAEGIWSDFSYIQTRIRNRLSVKKTTVLAMLCAWWKVQDSTVKFNALSKNIHFGAISTLEQVCSLFAEGDYHVFNDDVPHLPTQADSDKICARKEVAQVAQELAADGGEAAVHDLLIDPLFADIMHEVFADVNRSPY